MVSTMHFISYFVAEQTAAHIKTGPFLLEQVLFKMFNHENISNWRNWPGRH